MKRKVICFFILVFWGLIICTLLSICIEQQMMAQVTTVISKDSVNFQLPLNALVIDDEGSHLYEVVKGSGWESGNRVQEVNSYEYTVEADHISILRGASYVYIQYTSKPIAVGEQVQIVRPYQGEKTHYLVIASDESKLPVEWSEKISVVEENESAALLFMSGTYPYMEAQVRNVLSISEKNQIYSLGDISTFFENIPMIAAMLILVIASLFLWGYSCLLSRNLCDNKLLLVGNGIVGLVLLGIFSQITYAIHLPASLLPAKNILDFEYYYHEFSEILETLKGFSNDVSKETVTAFIHNMWLAAGVILMGLLCSIVVLLLEYQIIKWREHKFFDGK